MEENVYTTDVDVGVNKSPMNEVFLDPESRRFLTNMPCCDGTNYMHSFGHGWGDNSNIFTDENSEDDSGRQHSLFYRERRRLGATKKMVGGSFPTNYNRNSLYSSGIQSDNLQKTFAGQRRFEEHTDLTANYIPAPIFHTDSSTKNGIFLKCQYKPDCLIQTTHNPTIGKKITTSCTYDGLAIRNGKTFGTYDHFKNSFIDQYDVKRRKQMLSRSLVCGNTSDQKHLPIIDMDAVRNKSQHYDQSTAYEATSKNINDLEMSTQRAHPENMPPKIPKYEYTTGSNGFFCGQLDLNPNIQNDVEVKYKNKEFHEKETQKNLFKTQETYHESGVEQSSLSESSASNVKNEASLNKICLMGARKDCSLNVSARSHGSKASTISRKNFDNLVNLEKSKCNTITVIDDGLHRLQNSCNGTRSNLLPEKSMRSLNEQSHIVQGQKQKTQNIMHPELLNNMFKEYRGYHLENMKQEIKRIQYLDSLPEKWAKEMFSSV